MRNRKELAKHFSDLNFKLGAEIGVMGGGYSMTLCQENPALTLYCIDSWGLGGGRYHRYHVKKYEEAKERLAPYRANLMRKPSLEAVNDFGMESLDFVYIDADHSFDQVMRDIIEWTRRVRRGGIISGHDYLNSERSGVKDAVDVYVKHHGYDLHVTRETDKNGLSWWFMK